MSKRQASTPTATGKRFTAETILGLLLLIALAAPHQSTIAADIQTNLSTRETYVGIPTVLRVAINNAVEHDTPRFPEVPGLTIEQTGAPSTRSQTSWINGRRTQRTSIIYSFLVTPNQEGTFTIPPIQIKADGVTTLTEAVRVVATKSETGDLLFAEISGDQSQLYVGQSLQLTLKFWLRPYRNQEYRIELNEEEMWSCLSDRTAWGMFEDRMTELAEQRKRPGGRRVLREDSEGQQREYLLYEITTKIYPDRAREIDAKDTRLIFNYPVNLGRSRSPLDIFGNDDFFSGTPFGNSGFGGFGNRVTISETRPIVAEIAVEPIKVIPVPSQGRPQSYVGAVGKYIIKATATPTDIKTSDPITLTIEIQGDGPMDVLRAPDLNKQKQVTDRFKVADDSLAGTVSGDRKTFTTTLRPLNANVSEIPGIEYSYFDPDSESFVTISSDPIPIQVEEAEVLALSPNGLKTNAADPSKDQATDQEERSNRPPVSLFDSIDTLKNRDAYRFWSTVVAAAFALPPTLFGVFLLVSKRDSVTSLLPLRYQFKTALDRAHGIEEIKFALEQYLSRKYRITGSNHLRSTLLGQVRTAGDYRLAERIERIFHRDQHHTGSQFNDCVQEAEAIVEAIEQLNRRFLLRRGKTNTIAILAVATAIHFDCESALANQTTILIDSMLNSEQRAALLSSGCEKFRRAVSEDATDKANQMFRQAASDFQLLVDDGVRNDTLFYNLAEAYRYSGLMPLAVANYRSALALSPNNKLYYERLLSLEAERRKDQDKSGWANSDWHITSRRWIVKATGNWALQTCFWLGWVCLWALGLAHLTQTLPGTRALLVAATLTCGSSGLLTAAHLAEFQNTDRLVIREPNLEIREGDGEQFTIIETLSNADTKLVDLLQQRGDWAYIQWEPQQKGWIRLTDGVPITK